MWPKEKRLGTFTGIWVPRDTRARIVDFVLAFSGRLVPGLRRYPDRTRRRRRPLLFQHVFTRTRPISAGLAAARARWVPFSE